MAKECYYCGCRLGEDEGVLRFDEVKVGRMGSSWTVRVGGSATASRNPSRRGAGSTSRNSGRTLYKTMRIWACDECNAHKVKWARIKFWIKMGIVGTIAGCMAYIASPLATVKAPSPKKEIQKSLSAPNISKQLYK
jgi:hypothetical protein